ncbi:hypothetical protein B0H13DRAFT_1867784 [Mycena leptocephala]|nr:hypothetical protein B0H13DRAFT_1867784 [Mycena leptocephala]
MNGPLLALCSTPPRALLKAFAYPPAKRSKKKKNQVIPQTVFHPLLWRLPRQNTRERRVSSHVLNAGWFRTVYRHHPHTDKTPIHVHIVNNLRGRPIFAGDAPLTTPYIHNAVLGIPVPPIPVSAFHTESLGGSRCACAGPSSRTTLTLREDEVFVPAVVTTGKSVPMRGSGNVLMEDERVLVDGQYRGAKTGRRFAKVERSPMTFRIVFRKASTPQSPALPKHIDAPSYSQVITDELTLLDLTDSGRYLS